MLYSDEKLQDDAEAAKMARAERMERINNKLHALMWVILACTTVYYTDFFRVLLENPRVDRYVAETEPLNLPPLLSRHI